MDKRIITISRQCGSGGHTIGMKVAERLGIPFYDKKILEMVSERSGFSKEIIQQEGEYRPTGLLYDIAANLPYANHFAGNGYTPLPDQIYAFQKKLIQELAEKESCVIVGRCADYILRGRTDGFHVFIKGNLEDRISRVVSEHSIPSEKAATHVLGRDKKRSQHYRHYTDCPWGMAENYTLCLDSSFYGVERCVDMILDSLR